MLRLREALPAHARASGSSFPSALADEIRWAHPRGRVLVAVEGSDARSTGRFADLLAVALRVGDRTTFRASASDFLTATGMDSTLLLAALLRPFRDGEAFVLRGSRADGDVLFDPGWTSAPADALLVVDGVGLGEVQRAGLWDHRVQVELPGADELRPNRPGEGAELMVSITLHQ